MMVKANGKKINFSFHHGELKVTVMIDVHRK